MHRLDVGLPSAIAAPVRTSGPGGGTPAAATPISRGIAAGGSPGAGRVLCLVLALRALQALEANARSKV